VAARGADGDDGVDRRARPGQLGGGRLRVQGALAEEEDRGGGQERREDPSACPVPTSERESIPTKHLGTSTFGVAGGAVTAGRRPPGRSPGGSRRERSRRPAPPGCGGRRSRATCAARQ